MTSKTHMSPVAKHIRKTFKEQMWLYEGHEQHYRRAIPMCSRIPFDIWMNDYLFPELLQLGNVGASRNGAPVYNWACYYFDEETILRIMAEAGIID